MATNNTDGVLSSLETIKDTIEKSSSSLESLNEKALKGGLGFGELIKAVDSTASSFDKLIKGVGGLGSALTGGLDMGAISGTFSMLGDSIKFVMGGASELIGIVDELGKGIDSVTGYHRSLNASMYETIASFGGSFQAAKQYSEYIISSAEDFAKAEVGFISPAERIAATKGLEQAGIPLEHMSDIIKSATGEMDLLNTSILHSQSLGLTLTEYTGFLGDAMLKQGLTSQEATEQIAGFGDASQKTGIRADKIAQSLTRTANNFSKLGLSASFGQPILEGFSDTLKDMGLGFENAIELSENLSNALVNLGSNYAAAYLTFQRGGLDMGNSGGGGGALSAGIELRSRMADPNEDQGKLAVEMANGLKDTLSSFTGGQIVTLSDARDDSTLETAFFTQTQLLKDIYGITDTADQDRTLDLLAQLGDATTQGNADLAASLSEDLRAVREGRSGTMSYEEKTAVATEGTYAELQRLNAHIIEGVRLSGDELAEMVSEFQGKSIDAITPSLERANAAVNPEEALVDFKSAFSSVGMTIDSGMQQLNASIQGLDITDSLITALDGTVLTIANPGGDTAMGKLKTSIDSLVLTITQYIQKRENPII